VALLRVPRRVVAVVAQLALVLALAALVGLGLLPQTGWYRPVTVLSGSMQPAFSPGDMVVVMPEPVSAVRVGQVISYRIPVGDHHVQSHRVIEVLRRNGDVSVRTKGDANKTPDPWTATLHGPTAWRVRAVLPKLGWIVFWLRTPLVHELTLFLAPLLLALLAVLQIWRRPAEPPPEGHDAVRTSSA
jgi:signal peptidase I